jgi:hypothetical protein
MEGLLNLLGYIFSAIASVLWKRNEDEEEKNKS